MKKRGWIDAKFEVVNPPSPAARQEPQSWNGIGLPPEFAGWPWWAKILYVVVFFALWGAMAYGAHVLVRDYISF